MKTIRFVVSQKVFEEIAGRPPVGLPVIPMEVNLDNLTGPARRLAEGIEHTARGDESLVDIRSTISYADLIRRDWNKTEIEGRQFDKGQFINDPSPEAFIAHLRGVYGNNILDRRIKYEYRWDALHRFNNQLETPEAYFERHAKRIIEGDGEILQCYNEPYWMTVSQARLFSSKWYGKIPRVTLKKAFERGTIANSRVSEWATDRGEWTAPIGDVIDYLKKYFGVSSHTTG